MTGPARLAQDAVTRTLRVGDSAALVTEYMPSGRTLIINTGPTTIYVGTSSSLSPGNGVPIMPGTSAPWSQPGGCLYAIADPAGAAAATVTVTSLLSGWDNPIATASAVLTSGLAQAIALATAQALLATGVPDVLLGTYMSTASTGTASLSVGQYASLSIAMQSVLYPVSVQLKWFADAGHTLLISTDEIPLVANNMLYQFSIPVRGPYLAIVPNLAVMVDVSIYGSNRPLTDLVIWAPEHGGAFQLTQTWTAGISVVLPNMKNNAPYMISRGGIATIRLYQGDSTFQGYLGFRSYDVYGNSIDILATNPVVAGPGYQQSFQLSVPAGPIQWLYYPLVSTATATLVQIVVSLPT